MTPTQILDYSNNGVNDFFFLKEFLCPVFVLLDKNQRLLPQIMHQSVSSPSEDELRKKRALLAEAAEKRR